MAHAAAAVAEENLGRPLPIRFSRIERFEGQPRTFFIESGIIALADSIETDGQEQPIKVTTKPGEPGAFILIDGERRLRAFGLIFERTGKEPIIDAFVEVVKDLKQHFRKSTLANLHREDLSPLDEAAAYHRLREDGETIEDLMRLRGKSRTYVENYLKLNTLPDKAKTLMDPNRSKDTQLTVTQAIDIVRGIPESAPDLRITVAQEAIERNLGVVETRALIEHRSGSSGYRAGGRFRKPSDDYNVFTSFLGRARTTAGRMLNDLDIDDLYLHRNDDEQDRKNDTITINAIISVLEKLRDKINEKQ
ncbi:MAG: Chromosome (plasmid) partitioning protein ParB / Stage 0 sporulation protein J [Parcubacteria bacterium C7867-007]|nr:MAG: Chromosome (plasmid) partitioning protein ParB / Stage 0 sporulation protein J [Parcubacteria bacterium C7867-007]